MTALRRYSPARLVRGWSPAGFETHENGCTVAELVDAAAKDSRNKHLT